MLIMLRGSFCEDCSMVPRCAILAADDCSIMVTRLMLKLDPITLLKSPTLDDDAPSIGLVLSEMSVFSDLSELSARKLLNL